MMVLLHVLLSLGLVMAGFQACALLTWRRRYQEGRDAAFREARPHVVSLGQELGRARADVAQAQSEAARARQALQVSVLESLRDKQQAKAYYPAWLEWRRQMEQANFHRETRAPEKPH